MIFIFPVITAYYEYLGQVWIPLYDALDILQYEGFPENNVWLSGSFLLLYLLFCLVFEYTVSVCNVYDEKLFQHSSEIAIRIIDIKVNKISSRFILLVDWGGRWYRLRIVMQIQTEFFKVFFSYKQTYSYAVNVTRIIRTWWHLN